MQELSAVKQSDKTPISRLLQMLVDRHKDVHEAVAVAAKVTDMTKAQIRRLYREETRSVHEEALFLLCDHLKQPPQQWVLENSYARLSAQFVRKHAKTVPPISNNKSKGDPIELSGTRLPISIFRDYAAANRGTRLSMLAAYSENAAKASSRRISLSAPIHMRFSSPQFEGLFEPVVMEVDISKRDPQPGELVVAQLNDQPPSVVAFRGTVGEGDAEEYIEQVPPFVSRFVHPVVPNHDRVESHRVIIGGYVRFVDATIKPRNSSGQLWG